VFARILSPINTIVFRFRLKVAKSVFLIFNHKSSNMAPIHLQGKLMIATQNKTICLWVLDNISPIHRVSPYRHIPPTDLMPFRVRSHHHAKPQHPVQGHTTHTLVWDRPPVDGSPYRDRRHSTLAYRVLTTPPSERSRMGTCAKV